MSRLLLDAGAFIAFERGDVRLRARLTAARRLGFELATTSPVIAQVWRNGGRQALMARLVAATRIDAPDEAAARRAGELLARTRTVDVVDGLLVALVRPGDSVVTSDPGDIKKLLAAAASTAAVVLI
jgi:predicted nucleic acid-binding protein